MKRIVRTFLNIIIALSLISCGSSQKNVPSKEPVSEVHSLAAAQAAGMPIETRSPEELKVWEESRAAAASGALTSAVPAYRGSGSAAAAGNAGQSPPAEQPAVKIKVYLNGNNLILHTAPAVKDGVVLVPVEEILSAFSRSFGFTGGDGKLTVEDTGRGNTIILTEGSSGASLNGSTVALDSAPVLSEDGIMLIPLSAFRTLFDADNKYMEEFTSAYIVESGLC